MRSVSLEAAAARQQAIKARAIEEANKKAEEASTIVNMPRMIDL